MTAITAPAATPRQRAELLHNATADALRLRDSIRAWAAHHGVTADRAEKARRRRCPGLAALIDYHDGGKA